MNPSIPQERPRKRRAINACAGCRTSKVRCDGERPCQRCVRNNILCQYHDAVRDPNELRIERLESDLAALKQDYYASRTEPQGTPTSTRNALVTTLDPCKSASIPDHHATSGTSVVHRTAVSHVVDLTTLSCSAVDEGLISWDQASSWFRRNVLLFVVVLELLTSSLVSSLAVIISFPFSANELIPSHPFQLAMPFFSMPLLSIGCRAEMGISSSIYHRLQAHLRKHLTNTLIDTSVPSVEVIQAITLMAGYSDNGFILIALALRFALAQGFPNAVDQLMAKASNRAREIGSEERELYRIARIWHGICNLELFFSLDGGKLPSISLQTSSRRIRALVHHSEKTQIDLRLLSQIELNIIRANAYEGVARQLRTSTLPGNESVLHLVLQETSIELSLWLEEWMAIIASVATEIEKPLATLNLHIQYEWAIITLNLRVLSSPGIENVAVMDEAQRAMIRTAKDASARHLHYLLESPTPRTLSVDSLDRTRSPPYLSTFKWTMDYVWAKCAFSVLLALKLALLLRDPLPSVMLLLRDAHKVLEELERVAVGHIAYFQILQTSIEKCESALGEYIAQQENSDITLDDPSDNSRSAGDDFQEYAPSEFVFEWDFPGLNLKHMPLGWHDLFIDLDNVF